MADRSDYPLFVAARWNRLLRTAYLLVQDWQAAEDLTQAALVKAWLAWPRVGVSLSGPSSAGVLPPRPQGVTWK